MKQEVKDIVLNVIYNAPTSVAAWLSTLDWTTAIPIVLGLLQGAYLVRKWWREETAWGLRLKRWANGQPTQPGDLS